jgi:tetratricopeptide (TPR) repeat protein
LVVDGFAYYSGERKTSYSRKNNEAIECCDRAVKMNPNNVDDRNNKGLGLFFLRKFNEALECYERVIQIDPNNVDTWNNKGLVLNDLGKYNEALECYERDIIKQAIRHS